MEYANTYVQIDLDAIEQNFRAVLKKANGPVMAVVKADAYGHGAVPVAKVLEPLCAFFGVSSEAEALELTCAGIKKPILKHNAFIQACLLSGMVRVVIYHPDLVVKFILILQLPQGSPPCIRTEHACYHTCHFSRFQLKTVFPKLHPMYGLPLPEMRHRRTHSNRTMLCLP